MYICVYMLTAQVVNYRKSSTHFCGNSLKLKVRRARENEANFYNFYNCDEINIKNNIFELLCVVLN
jgi:hypothetical protein